MATLEQIDSKLDRVENVVIEVKTVLLGVNGDKGLCGEVKDNTKRINTNRLILVAALSSGILGLGTGLASLLDLITK